MKPGSYNLDLYRGDTYKWQFQLFQDNDQTQPVNLTGATLKSEIRDKTAGTVVIPITCTLSATPTDGIINAVLAATAFAGMPQHGVWDLQVTFSNGDIHTVLAGTVTVTADVTDSVAMP